MTQTLFDIVIGIFLFESLFLLILGTLYLIEQAILEMFGYDIFKVIKERMKKYDNK